MNLIFFYSCSTSFAAQCMLFALMSGIVGPLLFVAVVVVVIDVV